MAFKKLSINMKLKFGELKNNINPFSPSLSHIFNTRSCKIMEKIQLSKPSGIESNWLAKCTHESENIYTKSRGWESSKVRPSTRAKWKFPLNCKCWHEKSIEFAKRQTSSWTFELARSTWPKNYRRMSTNMSEAFFHALFLPVCLFCLSNRTMSMWCLVDCW